MKWSILILTVPDRIEKLNRLLAILQPQLGPSKGLVEVLINNTERHGSDNSSFCRGSKRNSLVALSHSEYFSFVDDDDVVSSTYVDDILTALEKKPDVVTFKGWMTTNGDNHIDFVIRLGEQYLMRDGIYYRYPNHLCVFNKRLVQEIRFPNIHHGEDYEWAKEIHDKKILQNEIHIEKQLYHYDYITK